MTESNASERFYTFVARFESLIAEAELNGIQAFAGSDCCDCSRGYFGIYDDDSDLFARVYDPEVGS